MGLALTHRLVQAMCVLPAPALRHIVVLAFTAYAMRGDEARMREAGCDGYLCKPIDVATFAASVRGHLPGG